jgi:hypothetical protein
MTHNSSTEENVQSANTDFVGKSLLRLMKTPTEWQQPRVNGSITVSEPVISIIAGEYDNDLPATCKMYLEPSYIID